VKRLAALRRQYGREQEPFAVMLALLEPPLVYREPIERFAETIVDQLR
jgi:hypothetical protein